MAVPQVKISRRMTRHRRSHHALKPPTLITCTNCSALARPHRVCHQCGHYKGQEVLKVENY